MRFRYLRDPLFLVCLATYFINRLVLRTSVLRRRSLQRRERQAQSIKEIDLLLAAIARRDIEAARQAVLTNVANSAKSALLADERARTAAAPRPR